MTYFRPSIDALAPYVPGEQPAAGERVIKLNTNENPYPPSPKAMEVVHCFDPELLRRYSHPYAEQFQQAAAEVLGVEPDWILAGNGSDDLLTMLMRSAGEPGKKVVYPMPTYVLYRTLAQIQDAEVVEIPFDDEYNLPVDALVEQQGAITMIANPNSPSGTMTSNETLAQLAERLNGLLVVDEAYYDFADSTALPLVKLYDNVIVLRTLSKGYSLAGLRLGFAIANPKTLEGLAKVKDSYNVDAIASRAGAAAMLDQAHKNANCDKIKASRKTLTDALTAMGFTVLPSQANFLLAKPPAGDAERLYEGLKARKILVRYFKQPRLDDKLRITVGTDEENAALIDALKELL